MTYKYVTEKIKLPKEFDRRIKLSDEQRAEIREKYKTGFYSQRQLAKEYNVSRRLITFILDDEKKAKCAEQFKERRKDGRYKPTKEERAAIQREHRRYKYSLYKKGLLKLAAENKIKESEKPL